MMGLSGDKLRIVFVIVLALLAIAMALSGFGVRLET